MATIAISNLSPTGHKLFLDSENYLDEMADNEINQVQGGWVIFAVGAVAYTVSYAYGRWG